VKAIYLRDQGVHYVLVNGTTGESLKLSIEEREQLLEKWVEIGKEYDIKVFAHVGDNCLDSSRRMATHANHIGAYGIVAMPPTFFRPANVPLLVRTMAYIAEAAPNLPFYYYHIPSMTGVTFKLFDFLKEADSSNSIPNLVGAKFSDADMMDFTLSLRFKNEKYDLLFGKDEQLTAALVAGAKGAVGSTYNFMGKIMNELITAYHKGDIKRTQEILKIEQEMVDLYGKYPGCDFGKAILQMKGIPIGPPRLPHIAFSEYEQLQSKLKIIGVL